MKKKLLMKLEPPFQRPEWIELEYNEEAGKNNQPLYRSKGSSRLKTAIWEKRDEDERT